MGVALLTVGQLPFLGLFELQNLPETRKLTFQFSLPDGNQGKQLKEDKGCTACHKGAMALENRLGSLALTEVAAGMWNHAPQMRKKLTKAGAASWHTKIRRLPGSVLSANT